MQPPFWRHFWQMFAVMMAGMIGSAAIFLTVVQMDWEEATASHPVASLLVIAAGMTVPMAAWMLYRGMGWRNTSEMAAAMILPVVPFLCLVWFEVTKSRAMRGVLRNRDRGDARTHVVPPSGLLDGNG